MYSTDVCDFGVNDVPILTYQGAEWRLDYLLTKGFTPYIYVQDKEGERIVVPCSWEGFDVQTLTKEDLASPMLSIWSFGAQGQYQKHKAPYYPTAESLEYLYGTWGAEPYTPENKPENNVIASKLHPEEMADYYCCDEDDGDDEDWLY